MTNPNKADVAGEISPMPTTLQIPADLTLLLSRQVLSEYSLACDAAQTAAEQCAIPDHPSQHGVPTTSLRNPTVSVSRR